VDLHYYRKPKQQHLDGILFMFRGASTLSLDDKGRFAIPTKYRNQLLADNGGEIICTINLSDPCLLLYPLSEWQVIEQRLASLSNIKPRAKRMQRLLLGNAMDYQVDKNGRVLLAPHLRDYAQLGKKIVLVGQLNKFEIWDEARWQQQMQDDIAIELGQEFEQDEDLADFSF
tara:strand:- start:5341 stop:5856 length:516 start_codon:yes stop_codon:yes gene_type:complete